MLRTNIQRTRDLVFAYAAEFDALANLNHNLALRKLQTCDKLREQQLSAVNAIEPRLHCDIIRYLLSTVVYQTHAAGFLLKIALSIPDITRLGNTPTQIRQW